MPKRKTVKKHKVLPCADANQHIRESIAERQRQRDAIVKKIAEERARQMLAHQQMNAITGDGGDSSTISALGSEE